MQNINGWRALPLPFIPHKAGGQLAIAHLPSPISQLHGLTSLPVPLPVPPAIYPDPHAILTLPSGEGRAGGLPAGGVSQESRCDREMDASCKRRFAGTA